MRETPPAYTCPRHGTELTPDGDALVCADAHRYEIRGGVARFVGGPTFADAFGVQWNRYRTTQLDSVSGVPVSGDRMRRCLGDALWQQLPMLDVLEAGCGAGRFTEVLLGRGARVTSVDLSSAVDANARNFPPDERHRIAQAAIESMPFAPRTFDLVFCLGVVQHTSDSERTITSLYEHVRPGGWLVIDHYTFKPGWYLSTAPLFRSVLRRVNPDVGQVATDRLVKAFLPLHKRAGRLEPLLRRVSPVHAYYDLLPELSEDAQREWALVDTHDALTDTYKHRRSRDQIQSFLEKLGAVDVWCEHGGNGVEARARRPAI